MNRLPVLLTRPERGSAEFAALLREAARDIEIITGPLIRIEAMRPAALPGPEDAVIFTSVSSVEVFSAWQEGAGRRAWCVGERTARAAQAAGFEAVAGAGTAAQLLEIIRAEESTGLLWHLHGKHQRGDLAGDLLALGIQARSEVIYDQPAVPLDPAARARIEAGEAMVAPLFSPRTAGLLAADVKNIGANLRVVALSEAVADEWPGPCALADRPDAEAMRDTVLRESG
ncbi:uroporphyrinogen-III synthase [Vannielia litorea]|uniref:uroporphyrinogen-III synthase n=1 Tax=Vannielia litorea TaxID=1217970 RepID=UPI001C970D4A|nr:uroporphyrinogen-III synthase [Vannielia litorea]MBY6154996.1 uroporphyrinogen-III synthase [Vannielia litorea]